MYRISIPSKPPRANTRLRPTAEGLLVRRDGVKAWKASAGNHALVQLRRQGLFSPLNGPLYALFAFEQARGVRDWDAGLKDCSDALNGIAWEDDRQVTLGVSLLVRPGRKDETRIWIARPVELDAFLGLVRELTTAGASPLAGVRCST